MTVAPAASVVFVPPLLGAVFRDASKLGSGQDFTERWPTRIRVCVFGVCALGWCVDAKRRTHWYGWVRFWLVGTGWYWYGSPVTGHVTVIRRDVTRYVTLCSVTGALRHALRRFARCRLWRFRLASR